MSLTERCSKDLWNSETIWHSELLQNSLLDCIHQIVLLFDPQHSDVLHGLSKPTESPRQLKDGQDAFHSVDFLRIAEIDTALLRSEIVLGQEFTDFAYALL